MLLACFELCSCQSVKLGLGRSLTNRDKTTVEQERADGATVVLAAIPNGWTKPFKLPMNDIWRDLHLRGVNYFTFGAPHGLSGYSSRADFRSPRYQAWMGVYAVEAKQNVFRVENESINRNPASLIRQLARLVEHDQNAWLRASGDPSPRASSRHFRRAGTLRIASADRAVFEATMASHSDLSSTGGGVAGMLGHPKPNYWLPHLAPNHDIILEGFYVPWYAPESRTVFVAYANASSFTTKEGETIDYTRTLRPELETMLSGIIIRGMAQ